MIYNMYRADYEDDEFEIIYADSNYEALKEAKRLEEENGLLFNLFLIDDDYNEIETVY